MKTKNIIEEIKAYQVVVPARAGSTDSPALGSFMKGQPWDQWPICLLEFRMSDGIRALGEVGRGHSLQSIEPWLKQLIHVGFSGPSLALLPSTFRGRSFAGLLDSYPTAWWSSPSPVIGAIEMALLDWAGKRLECRVVDLLGGAYSENVPVDYWCGRQTPEDLDRTVTKAREHGFSGLKMKSRIGDRTVEQLRAIKQAGGAEFRVTIDPMFQWLNPHEALTMVRAMEPFAQGVRIEDPFPQDRPEFWQRLRQVSSIPLIWHARTLDVLRRALQDRCADGFNCSGPIGEFTIEAHAVEAAGYTCWHGSAIELGVGQVAHLHAAAAARSCVLHSDFVRGFVREHTLIGWDWPYCEGTLPLPKGPGLGVGLDHAA